MSEENSERPMGKYLSPFLGPAFSKEEISQLLNEYGLIHEEPKDYNSRVAELLASGKVVGWFQGRSELGPRALGGKECARRSEKDGK